MKQVHDIEYNSAFPFNSNVSIYISWSKESADLTWTKINRINLFKIKTLLRKHPELFESGFLYNYGICLSKNHPPKLRSLHMLRYGYSSELENYLPEDCFCKKEIFVSETDHDSLIVYQVRRKQRYQMEFLSSTSCARWQELCQSLDFKQFANFNRYFLI